MATVPAAVLRRILDACVAEDGKRRFDGEGGGGMGGAGWMVGKMGRWDCCGERGGGGYGGMGRGVFTDRLLVMCWMYCTLRVVDEMR
jgi:hypothetical protein